jgi:hypothetical protein
MIPRRAVSKPFNFLQHVDLWFSLNKSSVLLICFLKNVNLVIVTGKSGFQTTTPHSFKMYDSFVDITNFCSYRKERVSPCLNGSQVIIVWLTDILSGARPFLTNWKSLNWSRNSLSKFNAMSTKYAIGSRLESDNTALHDLSIIILSSISRSSRRFISFEFFVWNVSRVHDLSFAH